MLINSFSKKILSTLLILLMMNTSCFAENWVTITAENGKSADLDLDSLNVVLDTVEYDIKMEKENTTFIHRFSTDLYKEGTPTAIISAVKLENNVKTPIQVENRVYRNLKQGTLQSEIYDVLSKELSEKEFNKGKNTWSKYLKKQQRLMTEQLNPGDFKKLNSRFVNKTESATPIYRSNIELQIDKYGTVVNRKTDDYYLQEVKKLDSLPADYSGKTYTVEVEMNYYKYVGAKTKTAKPTIIQNSPSKATVKISKNSRPPVFGHIQYGLLATYKACNDSLGSNSGLSILLIPVTLSGIIVSSISFLIFGGDVDDLGS